MQPLERAAHCRFTLCFIDQIVRLVHYSIAACLIATKPCSFLTNGVPESNVPLQKTLMDRLMA
ncbi:MAG: hypothetical protein QOF74_2068 [Caballeronia mineralivorans]|jgi:hypothetical protein|nr:hypothetical protein [Caballeronia mineralivorans]